MRICYFKLQTHKNEHGLCIINNVVVPNQFHRFTPPPPPPPGVYLFYMVLSNLLDKISEKEDPEQPYANAQVTVRVCW